MHPPCSLSLHILLIFAHELLRATIHYYRRLREAADAYERAQALAEYYEDPSEQVDLEPPFYLKCACCFMLVMMVLGIAFIVFLETVGHKYIPRAEPTPWI